MNIMLLILGLAQLVVAVVGLFSQLEVAYGDSVSSFFPTKQALRRRVRGLDM